jgi:MFS family permease
MDSLGGKASDGVGAVAACYGLTGVLAALWGATLAATDARLGLGPGRLGGSLMALAVGALVAMPLAGRLADRWTGRRLLRLTIPAAALALAGPAVAPSAELLALSAFVLGMQFGGLNVALTVQAVTVERAIGRPVIARMHGTWALGAVVGGAAVSTGLRGGVDVRVLMVAGGVALAVAGLTAGAKLPAWAPAVPTPSGADAWPGNVDATAWAPRPALVITLGIVGAAAFLTEGAATDWAGVHATRVLGAAPSTASLVYAVFFAAMTVVRFVGDAVRARLGAPTTIRLAGGTATAGHGLVLLSGALPAATPTRVACATVGWALAGVGMAVVWPVVISALGAASVRAGAAGSRLSVATTVSYSGGLIGPALIGYVAARATLPVALLIPAGLALLVSIVAPAALNTVINTLGPTSRSPPTRVLPSRRPFVNRQDIGSIKGGHEAQDRIRGRHHDRVRPTGRGPVPTRGPGRAGGWQQGERARLAQQHPQAALGESA